MVCNFNESIYEGSEKSISELELIMEYARKEMDCESGHCEGCVYLS
jgi:hypothetical protein